jgi:hypothetical protein
VVSLPDAPANKIDCLSFFITGLILSIDSFATLLSENNWFILSIIRFCSSSGGKGTFIA